MNITDEKNRLKNEIDKVNDPYILDQISFILSSNSGSSLITDEHYVILMEEREEYLKNPSLLTSLEDFQDKVKKKYGL